MEGLLVLVVIIDKDGDDGSEDLLAHGFVLRGLGEDNGGLDEPSLALVAGAAEDDLCVGAFLGVVDVAHAIVEGGLVDDGVDEGAEVADIADLDFLEHVADDTFHLRPEAGGHIGAGGCRAFLALELEGAAHDGCGHLGGVGRAVCEDEVLAAGFADNLRVGLVVGDIVADGLPEAVERAGGAGEVDTCEVGAGEGHLADERAAAGEEVDDAVGQAGLLVYLHQQIVGEHGGGGGLPDAGVAHEGGRHAEVGGDGGEVERRDGKHEAFQRTVGDVVQRAGVADGLVAVDLRGIEGIPAEEVGELAGAVDFGLHGGLALAEHGGGVDEPAVLAADEGGDLLHDAGAVNPGGVGPFLVSLHGCVDGHLDLFLAHLVVFGEDVVVLRGHHDGAGLGGAHLLAADDSGDVGHDVIEFVEGFADFFALRAAGLVTEHGLVLRFRERENGVVHNAMCLMFLLT